MDPFLVRLSARLKTKGLDLGEEAVALVAAGLFDELKHEVLNNDKEWDDVIAPFVDLAKSGALAAVDKIDGEDDEGR